LLLGMSGCQARPAALTSPAKANVAPSVSRDETIEHMRQSIERDVAAGFSAPDQIEQDAVEGYSEGQDPESLRPEARKFLREALAKHAAAQASWPAETDCDRLDKAFADLEQDGIVARQNFSDCGTCGVAEIGAEIAAARQSGSKVRGYVFYHMQDTESASEGGGLFLNYGAVDPDKNADLKIAANVVETLKRRGLETDWDGTNEKRIGVKLDWKRRRP
jgi:hypothetical protein